MKPMKTQQLRAPFPYAGGKSKIAARIWSRLGHNHRYIEPFFGSGAMLWAAPGKHQMEIVNDACGFVCNFWRAVSARPDEVEKWARWPVSELDLHARHLWLVNQKTDLSARLGGDPLWFDARIAGWWSWGAACWLGGAYCSGLGSWSARRGRLAKGESAKSGKVRRRKPQVTNSRGVLRKTGDLGVELRALSDRLESVKVCCGGFERVLTPEILGTRDRKTCAVFLDPPYDLGARDSQIYGHESDCAADVLAWCAQNGANLRLKIALCGLEGEHNELESLGWDKMAWDAGGAMSFIAGDKDGRGRANGRAERVWFSPGCVGKNEGPESNSDQGLFA